MFLPFLVVAGLSIAACSYCAQQVHKSEPRCVAQQVAVNCGEPALAKLVIQIIPQVVAALVSGNYSSILNELAGTLQQQGTQDALQAITCAVQQVDGNLKLAKQGANLNIETIKTHAELWLVSRKQSLN